MINSLDKLQDPNEIYSCLDIANPKSFFLFAGAGSGKTRTLVDALKKFRQNNIDYLRVTGQKIAIITYTNAACEEIKRRLEFDVSFNISTIHSFSWELIRYYHIDIKQWLNIKLAEDIAQLEAAQQKGKAGTKAAEDRPKQIAARRNRLNSLNTINRFTYNPNGENLGKDSLNHAEVIAICADFLSKRETLKKILIRKFPILFIDECQDTKKDLIDALFKVQKEYPKNFSLGLFGDTMQRIYLDGKEDLGIAPLPIDWVTPKKIYNYRSPRRIVKLINKMREGIDKNFQEPIKTDEGLVRLFIVDSNKNINKSAQESDISQMMANLTQDHLWKDEFDNKKVLILEHHMAASRGGFSNFFDPLYKVDNLKDSILEGTSANITFFSEKILPLIKFLDKNNNFAVSKIVNKHSPFLIKDNIKNSNNPKKILEIVKGAINSLYGLWGDGIEPTLLDIIREINKSGLFIIPETLKTIADRQQEFYEEEEEEDLILDAWEKALNAKFSEFKSYVSYISEESKFATHQGIKGLEFPRVMVIIDDEEARGFHFSYDKLFGVKQLTSTDIQNKTAGKDSSIDRTRRLFYVTCSRAEESLAIVAYTNEPEKVKKGVLHQKWFLEEEIIICS